MDPGNLIFITKTKQQGYFSCIFRCGHSEKSGVQEKVKFQRLNDVFGGPGVIFEQQNGPKGTLSARKGAKSEAFGAYTKCW